jgi:flagellar basal-body rod modification protein FlgD
MAVDGVDVNSVVGIDGNSYTTAISNDKLTNDDFLRLLLEELKMQDPTKPMDTAKMMDSQLQMSTIEANIDMSEAMKSLQTSYANSALSTAASIIGSIVENGAIRKDGLLKAFKVQNIENKDGTIYVNAREALGYEDNIAFVDGDTKTQIAYNTNGYLYDTNGKITNIRVKLNEDGRFDLDTEGNLVLLDENGDIITDTNITSKYVYLGETMRYSDEITTMLMSDITKVSR